MVAQLESTDRHLRNIVQSSFPLVSRPFEDIGRELGVTEEETMARVAALKKSNVLRQISAIFDSRRRGYKTSLVAMRFPQERLTKAAHHSNKHDGVSHNYARNSHLNLWFTLAVPPHEDRSQTVERLGQETNAEAVRMMPTLRFFKIGVNFDMQAEETASHCNGVSNSNKAIPHDWNVAEAVSEFEVEVICELQEDLPVCPSPFLDMAHRLGITEDDLFSYARAFQERGIMRRYGAVLHHRRAGFRANGMAVWKVPPERSEEVGQIMAAHPAVTHCYERPTFPDWPYTHFSMIHATSKARCEEIAGEISQQTGISDYQMLYSSREYKKTRVRYFA